ncbi:MAG TPA: thymidine phosphorylase [Gemmatales bacterium]|nr:thymidine phosphorylase [Gemmatales bacterium]
MRAVDVIRKKRDGLRLTTEELRCFIDGATKKTWEPYQISAMLMAITCRGLDEEETSELTALMVKSGTVLNWSDIPGTIVGKHSAGGVGDKTSLVLVPLAAACGCKVPKMSGRGLAHTGGTLDKLESIPGYRIDLSMAEFRAAVADVGCAIVGQTANLAPADKILYALRDVTATVESIPLIAGSIMSKKIAEGIHCLVLDVKVGHGAFMKTFEEARQLAKTMVNIGKHHKVRTVALLTDMDHPLGHAIGNSLEVIEAIETLRGRGPRDLEQLSVKLAAWLVLLSGQCTDLLQAEARVRDALNSGRGLAKFREMVDRQGGDARVVEDTNLFPQAKHHHYVPSPQSGYVASIHAEQLGRAAMLLGSGREKVEDVIDHSVGIVMKKKPGDKVHQGDALAELYYNNDARLSEAIVLVSDAYTLGAASMTMKPLVLETVT